MMAIEKASTSDIQYGFGNPKVDNFIAYGYYLVNSGQLKEGIKAFDAMLTIYPKLVAGRVGRGTAHALSYQFTQAVIDFTFAIELEPKCADAYKRRGQCLAARGDEALALNDFSKALELSPDLDTHFQRAQVYYKLKNWNKAIADFKSMIEFDSKNPNTWNYLGLCYDSIGDCNSSVNAHLKAIELKPDFKESHCNLGYTYRNWGKLGLAFKSFDKALEIDPSYSKAYHLRGFSYFAVGEHFKSISDMAKSAEIDPKHTDSYIMLGVAYHGVGNFRKCIESYDKALKLEPENPVWYQKELALWWQKKLDLPTQQYNIDLDLDAQFKEFWAKRNNWRLLKSYKKQPPLSTSIPDVETRVEPYTTNSPKERLLRFSEYYGNMLHTDSQGYVKNIRQLRMAGLATIQVAQVLRDFWFKNNDNIEPNLSTHPKARQSGKINWRFPFDLVVRWRQISEPNDPVWWVDLLTPEQFKEGFGSHTPMIIGQLHVVRYSPMVKVAFPLMKEGMLTQLNLSEEKQKIVQKATTLTELYNVVGKDFYIATPCESFLYPSTILEGTRITLQKSEPEGFEFSIRTAGTPARWEQYDAEMTSIWNKLTEAVREKPLDMDKVSNLILTFEFFWYNYMPLSRGSAAAGLIVMISMFLAIGIKIDTSIPKDFLLDWEGILRPKAADFIKVVSAWLYPARKPIDINQFDELPPVITTFPTLREMTTVLNLYSQ
uniref:Uncharacterized protein n=1 Tax=Arcella intermedia TaxID=1963864 RepID=A0A6B2KYK7_9EUKA